MAMQEERNANSKLIISGAGRVAAQRGDEHGVVLGARQRAVRQAEEALRQVGRRREQPRRIAHPALGAR